MQYISRFLMIGNWDYVLKDLEDMRVCYSKQELLYIPSFKFFIVEYK